MELKSEIIFNTLEADMANFLNGSTADYNVVIEDEENPNEELIKYMTKVSDNYNYFHNALSDLSSSLLGISRLLNDIENDKIDFVLINLEEKLKTFHIQLKTFWDVLTKLLSIVLRTKVSRKSVNHLDELGAFPNILDDIINIDIIINGFDKRFENRNNIIHEGRYEDKSIQEVYSYSVTGWMQDNDNYEKILKSKKLNLIHDKLSQIDNLCTEIFSTLTNLNSNIIDEYYKNEAKIIGK